MLNILQVRIIGGLFDRDAVKDNARVLAIAAKSLGLRVGVPTCTVHVRALYDIMKISCPRFFG